MFALVEAGILPAIIERNGRAGKALSLDGQRGRAIA